MQFILVIALIFALLVAVFAIQNAITVQVVLFAWKFKTSLVLVIFGSAILGALSVGLFSLVQYIQWKMKLRKQEQKISELESQLEELSVEDDLTAKRNSLTEERENETENKNEQED